MNDDKSPEQVEGQCRESSAAAGEVGSGVAAGPEATDHERRRAALIKAAEAGLAEAHIQLGLICLEGKHGLKNPDEAFEHMKVAADQGHSEACLYLGLFFDAGCGVASDSAASLDWFLRAEAKGSAGACVELGCRYFEGRGVSKDQAKALALFEKGAGLHSPEARLWLGYMHFKGVETLVDYARAGNFTIQAAQADIPEAWYQLYEIADFLADKEGCDWRVEAEWITPLEREEFALDKGAWPDLKRADIQLPKNIDELEVMEPLRILKGAAAREHPEALYHLGKLAGEIAPREEDENVRRKMMEEAQIFLDQALDLGSRGAKTDWVKQWILAKDRSRAAVVRLQAAKELSK